MSSAVNIGIDEVGRGPLAGPVVVCALALPPRFPHRVRALGTLRDSKKLAPAARERWFALIRGYPGVRYAVSRVSPRVIDRIGIAVAANRAAGRAYEMLATRIKRQATGTAVILDGGLYLRRRGWAEERGVRARTVVRADETVPAVSAASIVAKVLRDRYMARLARRYAGYGFEVHKGYGTRVHYAALRRLGPSPAHRLTFLRASR